MSTTDAGPLWFYGEALDLLRDLRRQMIGRSRDDVGLAADVAQQLLISACAKAIRSRSHRAGLEMLYDELEQPFEEWTIAFPVPRLFLPAPRVTVGRTVFARSLPSRFARAHIRALLAEELDGPVALTTVRAKDLLTARVLAEEQVSASCAVLDLVDRPTLPSRGSYGARERNGRNSWGHGFRGWILDGRFAASSGTLEHPYREIARALKRPAAERNDWQRRVIGAVIWYSRGARSRRPADRLASYMVGLEALFVEGRAIRAKGQAIADRVTSLFLRRGYTREEQTNWLVRLYTGRNEVVHEGREYEFDLDVDDLGDLAYFATMHAAWHLVPEHRPNSRSCRTFHEAMSCWGF